MTEALNALAGLGKAEIYEKLGFSLAHVGINGAREEEAMAIAQAFETLFGFPKKPGNSSVFAGSYVEIMKAPFRGQHGHIAIGTSDPDLAVAYLESQGYTFAPETAKRDDSGMLKAIYLEKEIGGFGIHLVKTK